MRLDAGICTVRSWRTSDLGSLVNHANNRNIWINLRDSFPYPYTRADGERWIKYAKRQIPETNFAISVGGRAAGAVGFHPQPDVHRRSAEIGYWVGEPFWGRGIATAALRAITNYAFENHDLCRIYATVFEWNTASMRVLEKCGYVREAVLQQSIVKDGRVIDSVLYAIVRKEVAGRESQVASQDSDFPQPEARGS